MSPPASPAAPVPALLSTPEEASPLFQHFDAQAGTFQANWRKAFVWSLRILGFISLVSTITGVGGLLKQPLGLTMNALRWFDGLSILFTTVGVVLEFRYQQRLRQQLNPWAVTRDHAERLRSAVWLYLFDLPLPLAASAPRPATSEATWQQLAHDLASGSPAAPPWAAEPTAELRDLRQHLHQASLAERLHTYCTHRLKSQQAYFTTQADRLQVRVRRNRRIVGVLLGAALVWNLVRLAAICFNETGVLAFFNSFNGFLLLIGLVGLYKAYTEAEDLEPLMARYHLMSKRLQERVSECPQAPLSAARFNHFVIESELILRDETLEWATRRGEPGPPPAEEPT